MLGTSMRLLVLDTCGELGSLALAEDRTVLRERTLPARSASAELVGAIREELAALAWPLRSLEAIGVVNGPGSFTGVRVGLAAAKGVCEVTGAKLLLLSRLEVLLTAGPHGDDSLALLDAGRGEFYVRSERGKDERLMSRADLSQIAAHAHVILAEEKLQLPLQDLQATLIDLAARHALPLALGKLSAGVDDVSSADANYVRSARTLYAGKSSAVPRQR